MSPDELQDCVNLGNFAELEDTAKEAYDNGMRDKVILTKCICNTRQLAPGPKVE